MEKLITRPLETVWGFVRKHPYLVGSIVLAWLLWETLAAWTPFKWIADLLIDLWRKIRDLEVTHPFLGKAIQVGLLLLLPLPMLLLLLLSNLGERSARQKLQASATTP